MAKPIKKPALGRGLSVLLEGPEDVQSAADKNAEKVVGSVFELDIEAIDLNPFQPRTNFKEEEITELAESISELGVIQPITVRKLKFGKYGLISGERRVRACKKLGMASIPAFVRIADDKEMLEMALVENIQRQDLDAIEIALSFQRLIQEINLTQEELSRRVGKKRATITNYLRLLKLNPIIQSGIRDGFLSMGHGKAIIGLEDNAAQLEIYQKIVSKGISVRETEELVKAYQEGRGHASSQGKPNKTPLPDFIDFAQRQLMQKIPNKVQIKMSGQSKGKMVISFDSKDQFDLLMTHFLDK